MIRIAILMSTYNGSKYLEEQINSILSQKLDGATIDVVIRDDGSEDHTVDLLNEYAKNGVVKWYAGENLKPAKSFFHLLLNCGNYDYYAFSDQDDVWDDDKIAVAIKILRSINGPACYHCNSRIMDSEGGVREGLTYSNTTAQIIEKSLENELCAGGAMGCTMVMNHKLVEIIRTKSFPSKMIMHDCFIQGLCKAVGGRVLFDPAPHMSYRQHASNVIGRGVGLRSAIKYRLDYLTSKKDVSIADQAAEILSMYSKFISERDQEVLDRVACYKSSFVNQLILAFSKKLAFRSFKDSLFMRVSILVGAR